MQINTENIEKCKKIAERLYELDGRVYECVGSSMGRSFPGNKEHAVRHLTELMYASPNGHLLRSEVALVSNMARTIQDKEVRSPLMREYDEILKEMADLPTTFGNVDILDLERAKLNSSNLRQTFSKDDHLVICISRTQGSGGNDIGFELADTLKINYYDVGIFNKVLSRLEADTGTVTDQECNIYEKRSRLTEGLQIKQKLKDISRYHGLPKQDAVFFNMSDLICSMARQEDCIIMGRCADVILKNNRIPHISIFIDAPFSLRMQRIMKVHNMNERQALHFLKKMDKQHKKYYNFYTGGTWGNPECYDLCINSASYGIEETVEVIERMIDRHPSWGKHNWNSNRQRQETI